MALFANAFDLLGEDSSYMKNILTFVEENRDVVEFLVAEKKKKEEQTLLLKKKIEEAHKAAKKKMENKMRDTLIKGVLTFPTHQRPNPNPNSTSTRRPSSPQENHDEQNQGVADAPSLKKKWVPKSENGEKKEEKENEEKETEVVVEGEEEQPKKEEEGSVVSSKSSVEGKRTNKNGSLRKKEKKAVAAAKGEKKGRSQNKVTLIVCKISRLHVC